MKKKISVILIAAAACLCVGCGGVSEDRMAFREDGIAKMQADDFTGAQECFTNALDSHSFPFLSKKMTEFDRDCYLYLALAQFKNGDDTAAKETYDQLIDADKKDWEAYYLRGCLALQQDDVSSAQADFEKAVGLKKDDVALYTQIYGNLLDKGYSDEAQAYLDQAVAIGGENAASLNQIGCGAMESQDYEEAINCFEKALSLDDGSLDQTLSRNLIAAYEYSGEYQIAFDQMEVYVKDYPDDEEAARDLEFLRTRVKTAK